MRFGCWCVVVLAVALLPLGCAEERKPRTVEAEDVTDSSRQTTPRGETPADVVPLQRAEPQPRAIGDGTGAVGEEPATVELSVPDSSDPAEPSESTDAAAELERQLVGLTVPASWVATTTSNWNTDKPWKEGRLEIRRLLSKNTEPTRREAIKLTWDYLQKDDIGNGHEYGMYLYLGAEPLWAVQAFREELDRPHGEYPPFFAARSLASLYEQYGVYDQAEAVLFDALTWKHPDDGYATMRRAEFNEHLGDLYAAWGRFDDATDHYRRAIQLYPTAKPKYGRHLLKRWVARTERKLDLLSIGSFADADLRDGTYRAGARGYSGDVNLTLTVRGGKLVSIDVDHQEKIDQGAATIIPQRIIDRQTLKVDGITGATVTEQAIVTGTLDGLRKAGFK